MFTGSAAFYDAVYGGKDYAAEAARVHALVQAHRRSPADTLLDVGCGTGAHLEHLAPSYGRVEGVDLDPKLLEVARERLPGVPFHVGDMADFRLGRRFGAVVTLFSAIGYVKTPERLRQTARTLAEHLEPGGVLVVEPWLSPERFRPGRPRADVGERPGFLVARMGTSRLVEDGSSVLDFHYLVGTEEGITSFTEHHELGLFTHEETLAAFADAGLELAVYDPEGLIGRGLYVWVRPE